MDPQVTYQYNSQYESQPPPPPPPPKRGFDFTKNMGVITILITCVLAFVWMQIDLASTANFWMWPDSNFRVWQFATSVFFHDPNSYSHIFWNMFMLYMFGMTLERAIGTNRFLVLFVLAGIVGNMGYVLYCLVSGSTTPAIGASGALYGVFACLAIIVPNMRVYLLFFMPMKIIHALLFYAAIDIVFMSSNDSVAHAAHLAGLVVGLIFGFYLKGKYQTKPEAQYQNTPYG
jgi:membrane associated rhomboid family serine protease